jgi:hypothetical protein
LTSSFAAPCYAQTIVRDREAPTFLGRRSTRTRNARIGLSMTPYLYQDASCITDIELRSSIASITAVPNQEPGRR